MPSAVDKRRARPGLRKRIQGFLALRARTWVMTVPLHLIAFLVLYGLTLQLVESGVVRAATDAARLLLADPIREIPSTMHGATDEAGGLHSLDILMRDHQEIDLKIYNVDGLSLQGGERHAVPGSDAIAQFQRDGEVDRFWVDDHGDQLRIHGLLRLQTDQRCEPCHELGTLKGAASMSLDFTRQYQASRAVLRRSAFLLILVWAGVVGVTTVLVKKAAQRSVGKMEQKLAAAAAGSEDPAESRHVVFDSVSAELQRSLHRFLKQQRERESAVAERLEHTDRLASLGQLAAGLAHEIKNPLAGIQGAIEILREDLPEEGSNRQLYGEMLGELDRVNQILQLLLTSARPSPPKLAEVNVQQLLADIEQLMAHGLRRQSVELEVWVSPGISTAPLDAAKVRQVLINLISNAAEAMESGGTVIVRAGPLPGEEGMILTVEDDGPGIPEENQSKIFDPFFTTKFSGTGLGLAIARTLVEQHGGSLEVESEQGKGTTFYLLLPRVCDLPDTETGAEES